jgi:hypothetical protein
MFVKTSVFVTDKRKALACGKICPFFVNYGSVKFYSTGPRLGEIAGLNLSNFTQQNFRSFSQGPKLPAFRKA